MTVQKITKEEYLDKNFDYTKLTKQELRQIMSENGVEDIPNLTALKSVILEAYKTHIHDRIDEFNKKTSEKNIFQREKNLQQPARADGSSSFQTNTDSEINTSFQTNSQQTGSLTRDTFSNPINSSFLNKSFEVEESNQTAVQKSKAPFIAIPKRTHEKPTETVEQKIQGTRRTYRVLRIVLLLFILACMYLKLFCPYCKPGANFCIPIPPHTRLVNNKLVVDKGYRLVHNLIDFCVPEGEKGDVTGKKVEEYVKKLEVLLGDYKYGFAKSPKMSVAVVSDPAVIEALIKTGKVSISDGMMQARKSRVTFTNFMKYYCYFMLKISVLVILLGIVFQVTLNRHRRRKETQKAATKIAKEVLDILNKQIVAAVKSNQFKPQVGAQQLKEALEIKDEVWQYVEETVSRNSNVEKSIEHGNVMWKWIGPVFYKNSENIDY